jgi:hypothetical protein
MRIDNRNEGMYVGKPKGMVKNVGMLSKILHDKSAERKEQRETRDECSSIWGKIKGDLSIKGTPGPRANTDVQVGYEWEMSRAGSEDRLREWEK